jgi:hypothetical protein
MRPVFTPGFVRQYQRLPQHLQRQFDKALVFLLSNLRHPYAAGKKDGRPARPGGPRYLGSPRHPSLPLHVRHRRRYVHPLSHWPPRYRTSSSPTPDTLNLLILTPLLGFPNVRKVDARRDDPPDHLYAPSTICRARRLCRSITPPISTVATCPALTMAFPCTNV